MSDEGDVYMWEGRSDYFPAEGRQPGSGSKKGGGGRMGGGSGTKARPIPGSGGRISLSGGGEGAGQLFGGSYGSPEGGSYGSYTRRSGGGSYIERFAREREAGSFSGGGGVPGSSYGAGGGAGSLGRPGDAQQQLGSGSKASARGGDDVFATIRPHRCGIVSRRIAPGLHL